VGKVATAETEDKPGMADAVATVGRAVLASDANASLMVSETAALAARLDPGAPAVLVAEVAMVVTAAKQDISRSLCHRGITICLTSEPLGAPVAVVAEEDPVWVASVARRERPAAADRAAKSAVASDVPGQVDQPVIQADPESQARPGPGEIGAIRVRSRSIYFETSDINLRLDAHRAQLTHPLPQVVLTVSKHI
jgi:hypothetical protein